MAAHIRADPIYEGWSVYYGHGDAATDSAVAATKGFFGSEVKNSNRLADIDILIASPGRVARVLIEIEECPCSPKKILGDILAALLCNGFAVRAGQEQKAFRVSSDTRLIVAGLLSGAGQGLRKIEDVVAYRIHQLQGLSDGISPKNVFLIFRQTITDTIRAVEDVLESWLPLGAA